MKTLKEKILLNLRKSKIKENTKKVVVFLKKATAKLQKYIKKHNELISIAFGLFLIAVNPTIVRAIEPQAIPYVGEVFEMALYALAIGFIFIGASFFMIKTLTPSVYNFKDKQFDKHFETFSPWRKTLILATSFCLFLFLFTLLFVVLIRL